MHIVAHGLEVTIAAAIHQQRLITAAEEMSEKFMPPVISRGVSAQEPFHAGHQVGLGSLNDQMKMISHQAPGMDLPIGLGASLCERLQKQLPIFIAAENVFPM